MEKLLQKYAPRDDLPLLEAARLGMLPESLKAWHIAWLYFPEKADEKKRTIFCKALNEAVGRGELKADTKEKKRAVRIAMKWIDGRPINPNARDEYETLRYYVIHRDDYKAFLQANNEWPPAPDSLIARWYSEQIADQAPAKVTTPRESDLHELLERTLLTLKPELARWPSAREVWRALQERADTLDIDQILYKIDGDIIEWRSMAGNTNTITYNGVANRLSKIRKKLSEKNHR
jgi:hypothetical protein